MTEHKFEQSLEPGHEGQCGICGEEHHGMLVHTNKRVVSTEDRVRVLRLIEYEGGREAVEQQLANSIHGTRVFQASWHNGRSSGRGPLRITAVTLGLYPDVVETGREVGEPRQVAELEAQLKVVGEVANEEIARLRLQIQTLQDAIRR